MRHYAWYSPEIDVIIFQIIMEGCYIAFEWSHFGMAEHLNFDNDIGVDAYLWIPLGEL